MRTMLKITIPIENGNQSVKDGSLPKTFETLVKDLNPEASYFYPENGKRAAIFVFDMKESSQLAEYGERIWQNLKADVSIFPVMNSEELQSGLGRTQKNAGRGAAAA